MKQRPILFSTAMVQAILAGNKSQTRRIQVRKAGGLICHVPLLEGDTANTVYFYFCTKSCLTKFKTTDKINLKIREAMLKAYNALRERSKKQ